MSRNVRNLVQSHLPRLKFLHVIRVQLLFMISQCFSKTTSKGGRCVVFREYNDENLGLLNSLLKCFCDLVPFLELLVINEGVNSPFPEDIVEIASETITSIFSSEAEEHIVGE
ncbi:hypothetical protein JHK84_045459 [Glycine max]|nr:hypothetical protein JHK86_045418 [Glycine max]KAG4941331.1 hypothetical protein JHK87_045202 [Glycine soja]KAG4952131.1 hypothetical protein JHK85_045998 [Glycine max]KAG5108552.1 hypothetical protein JHK84_045459 [Glycine max]